MKRIIVFVLFLASFESFWTQNSQLVEKSKFEFSLRGKALGFVFIEDIWVRTFSLGAELKFIDQFSLVVDVVHFRWRYEEEFYKDSTFVEYDEFSEFDARNYLALELRYYPKFLSFKQVKMYVNCFSKIGERKIRLQDTYPLEENRLIKQYGHFFDLGTSFGMEIGSDFGFDFNIGALYRKENKKEEYYHVGLPNTITERIDHNRWGMNIRTSFYYRF